MRLSPQLKMDIRKVLVITIAYVIINTFVALLINSSISSIYSLGPSDKYNFSTYMLLSALIGLLAGSFGGTAGVVVNNHIFRKKSFGFGLASVAVLFILVFVMLTLINALISANLNFNNPSFDQILAAIIEQFLNPLTLVTFFLWGVVSIFTLFMIQVNDKFGPGILWKFIRGQYHKPREEERIFMFADMRSSTTIAEKIGHKQYFNLLSDLFADITNTILNFEGVIYQYVGDEIIISWPLKNGIKQANCLRCFLKIEQKLLELDSKYEDKYGVRAELKAGIHHGMVTAGEIGVIKRDIIYSGDVLNTAERIQEQCNAYKVNLLISGDTLNLLEVGDLQVEPMGEFELRGKAKIVSLNRVSY